ncbi:MAG: GEVED domain-containing protein, partial [Holophagales bacterium]|nr:GEVED domain-containing protein [Holophagales bacterium]
PGGSVTFTVRVENTSGSEPVTLTSLVDDIHGDLDGQGTCSMPQTLTEGSSYSCTFSALVEGNAGDTETDTVTAAASDDEGNSVQAADTATVTITDVLPTVRVAKTASPQAVAEPGAVVNFTVKVDNTSPSESVTVSALVDDSHGNLGGQGTCSIPQTLAAGEAYQCQYSALVSGNGGESKVSSVSVTVSDDEGNNAQASGSAAVTVLDVMPSMRVTYQVSPDTVEEPGGEVAFTVRVANGGIASDPLTLLSLGDDSFGDLNGQGSCAIPQVLSPGAFYECTFPRAISGVAGDNKTSTVTAASTDDEANTVQTSAAATVTILGTDFGDAPDPSYPTLLASDGARHVLGSGLYLGAGADADSDGQPSGDASGDDLDGNDDDDGAAFPVLGRGQSRSLMVTASGPGLLSAWVDWNQDGDWSDSGEQVLTDRALVAGVNPGLAIHGPADAVIGTTYARLRFSTVAGLAPTGPAADGEVEDYAVEVDDILFADGFESGELGAWVPTAP